MKSEIIVVLFFIASAIGFILWVRKHSHSDEVKPQSDAADRESRSTKIN